MIEGDLVFVTGAGGLVGSKICEVIGAKSPRLEVTEDRGWEDALSGKKLLIHCASISSSRGRNAKSVMEVNVEGTKRIARIARKCGVERFLFLSSVKVFGESTSRGQRFGDGSPVSPGSVYGQSKALAEQALLELHRGESFEVVILRPTVVISPGSKGAIGAMAKFARKGFPFPVPCGDENRRDFVNLDNLVDAVLVAAEHPEAGGRAFSVTDGEVLSTESLYWNLADAYHRKARFFRVPEFPGRPMARFVGMKAAWERVFGNLEVDGSLIRDTLNWIPKRSTIEYIHKEFSLT